jgi:branched-chain amino acid transport system permease protein
MDLESFVRLTFSGLTVGMIYALISLGYTMVYGVLELINFAHGEVFTIGGYLGATFLLWVGINDGTPLYLKIVYVVLAFIISIILTSFLGWAIERIAYRPLRRMSRIAPLLTAIGVSIFLQNAIMLIWGVSPIEMPQAAVLSGQVVIFGAKVRYLALVIIFLSLFLMLALSLFIKRTKLGKAMRATSQDREAAEMMGIDTNKTIAFTFIIGSALAAIAGILVGMYYGTLKWDTGFLYGIKAFTAAVLGGIGNMTGAVIGSLILGMVENYGIGLPLGALAYFVLIFLLFGLFHQYLRIPLRLEREVLLKSSFDGGEAKKKVNKLKRIYYGGLITGIYYLRKERRDADLRRHARQAVLISTANILLLITFLLFYFNPKFQIGSDWRDVITFFVLMIVLIFRPSGIMGERLPEKV